MDTVAKQDLKQTRHSRKSRRSRQPTGFLGRLASNERGNALMIAAASMIPLTAAIGAGVDMSRAYATRTRMQQACDAGVLAVRRNISGNTLDTDSQTLGNQFFRVNFPPSTFGTTMNVNFTTSVVAATNTVAGTATATLPYTMMPVIGFNNQQITVKCEAAQDFVNTDIVLVLDNTGSMNCVPSGSAATSTQCGETEATGSKMQGQRDAVMALYDALSSAQTQLEAKGLRLRYGIVPYSQTVNVGKLLYGTNNSLNAIRTTSNYQQQTGTVCTKYDKNKNCTATSPVYGSTPFTHNSTYMNTWASAAATTQGCIEERATVNTVNATTTSAPSGAWDLDLDKMPSAGDPNTQWAPYDDATEKQSSLSACSKPVSPLQAFTRTALDTAVKKLTGKGYTYSGIGMIWGGRMISEAGVFAASPKSNAGFPVKKYIILMTDGYIDTESTAYSAWGIEAYDHRVSANPYPGDPTDLANHKQRFSLACSAAKSKVDALWVIGFGQAVGTGLDATLTNCASSPDLAYLAVDTPKLVAKFKDIGRAIGSLRVTK